MPPVLVYFYDVTTAIAARVAESTARRSSAPRAAVEPVPKKGIDE